MKKLIVFLLFALLACGRMAIAYPTATGGTITTNSGYRIHTFKSSGSFVVSGSGSLASDSLIVAGGGGGGVNDNSSSGGGGETNFTVFFGLQGAMANVYTGTGTNYTTGVLLKGEEYSWRVDSDNAVSEVTGDVWNFNSAFFVTAHKIMGVIDNTRLFGSKQGRRVWGK